MFTYEEALELYKLQSDRRNSMYLGYNELSDEVKMVLSDNGFEIPIEEESYFSSRTHYRSIVARLTNANCNHLDLSNRRFSGGDHVDHIVSVLYCFKNKIDPSLCASSENLQILTEQENFNKGSAINQKGAEIVDRWIREGKIKGYPHIKPRK